MNEIEFINKYIGYIKKISRERTKRNNTLNEPEDYSQSILERLIREYRYRKGVFPHSNVLVIIHQTAIDVYRKADPVAQNKALVTANKDKVETNKSKRVRLLQWHNNLEYDDTKNTSSFDTEDLYEFKELIEFGYGILESDRDKRMFQMFLEDHYFKDISMEYGLSLERSRQIIGNMMKKIKLKYEECHG